MSKYKRLMLNRGVMQKDVSASVRAVDPRVDTALMSKFVNDVCLPTPPVLKAICKTLSCAPLDIYDPREIALAPTAAETPATGGEPSTQIQHGRGNAAVITRFTILRWKSRATLPNAYSRPTRCESWDI